MPIPNPWRGLRGLPSDVWIIFATTLVNRAGVMALPFLVLYLTEYLHVSAALAGFAITTYGVGSLVTGPRRCRRSPSSCALLRVRPVPIVFAWREWSRLL